VAISSRCAPIVDLCFCQVRRTSRINLLADQSSGLQSVLQTIFDENYPAAIGGVVYCEQHPCQMPDSFDPPVISMDEIRSPDRALGILACSDFRPSLMVVGEADPCRFGVLGKTILASCSKTGRVVQNHTVR